MQIWSNINEYPTVHYFGILRHIAGTLLTCPVGQIFVNMIWSDMVEFSILH